MNDTGWGSKAQRDALAHSWLENVIRSLETAKAQRGSLNALAAKAAGDATRLLRFSDLESRVDRLLEGLTLSNTLKGAITNLQPNSPADQTPLSLRPLKEIEADYPAFSVAAVEAHIQNG